VSCRGTTAHEFRSLTVPGIMEMRGVMAEKEQNKSLKAKMRDKVRRF
jgi:hypothetical protein